MSSLAPAAIILALVLLNGLFVAAEFAAVGVPRGTLDRLAAAGHRSARLVVHVLADPRRQDRFIATAQLGITVASLGLGMYGEHVLAGALKRVLEPLTGVGPVAAHTIASAVSVTGLTYLHIVLGEMVPKSLALQYPERTALWVSPVVRVVQLAAYPLVLALNGAGNLVLRLVGIDRRVGSMERYSTPEELAYIVRESQAGGLLRKESAQVMRELLEFGDLTADSVMVPRVRMVALPVGASAAAAAAVLRARPHTRYPVYEGSPDRILGMVHVKDLLSCLVTDGSLTADRVRPVPVVPETASLDQVLVVMRRAHTHLVIVMDEYGGTAGLVTVEDLFEEVVGPITESPGAPAEVWRDADGRLHVAGTVRIEDVGAALGQVLEHREVSTVSGLILALLGRPPRVGDAVTYDGVRFEVVRVEGHGVAECIALSPLR